MRTHRLALLAIAAAALATACGESCPTGTADVESLPASCKLAANQTVTMFVELCPHCNETSPQCEVDTSAAASGKIFLNTFWELCEENQDCPGGDASCVVGGVACRFQVPPGEYTVISPNGLATQIVVTPGGDSSCSFQRS